MVFILSVSGIFIKMDKNKVKIKKQVQRDYLAKMITAKEKTAVDWQRINEMLSDLEYYTNSKEGIEIFLQCYVTILSDSQALIDIKPPKEFQEYHDKWTEVSKLEMEAVECLYRGITNNDKRQIVESSMLLDKSKHITKTIKSIDIK